MKTDIQLQHDVLEELSWEPSVDAAQVGVTVRDGVVTLTGYVPGFAERGAAERVAKRVYGVQAVVNELAVRLPGSHQRNDADIAAAAVHTLQWDSAVPAESLTVTVSNGWITLEGAVDWKFQKEAAERAVRHLTGVVGVTNAITITPRATPQAVKDQIEAAFRRHAEQDARQLRIETHGGKVILHGHVRSWAEREQAEEAAWAAPGVTHVESHLVLLP